MTYVVKPDTLPSAESKPEGSPSRLANKERLKPPQVVNTFRREEAQELVLVASEQEKATGPEGPNTFRHNSP